MTGTAETSRLAALRGYGVMDTPNEAEFDMIVRQAARVLGTPIALLSFVDHNRQWFKAKIGLEASETPRSISFCTHAIEGDEVFVVQDARRDARSDTNPLVTGDPNIRFYAGAPLRTPAGKRNGTLCIIDQDPRDALTEAQKAQLSALADRAVRALEARKGRMNAASKTLASAAMS